MRIIKIKPRVDKEFYLEGESQLGCLLVHGFTGTPGEMEPLGNYLNNCGYTVYAPLLSGHGTTPEDLAVTTKDQIFDSAFRGLERLKHCQKVVVIGLSMGGLISGLISLKTEIEGLVLMGTPVFLGDRKAYLAPVLKYIKPYIKKINNNDYPVTPTSYDRTPVSGISELLKLRHEFLVSLKEISVPTLIIQGMKDNTVRSESGRYIYNHIGSESASLLELENTRHIVTLDIERKEAFSTIDNFLTDLL
ncbi:alpha/beta hydrolase [Natranaerobius thermophilus]|uniref:Putative esterase/lipase n=1 Tax=Natranaerobius thermophilus (strain ATCC BAA-1301 / DSM 18059 / JW/NM-WN-LF) TaxID=457570 RepID=B2A6Y8_NATTJ|nr:alpha/beta fold hydrolase [Natranaerobius thermophilus]ACB85579.1 putative esterase/lipase [Natranaerobius thermophilus JW/NM-WN-LF]